MKKKDSPELYELLKRSDLNLSGKKAPEENVPETKTEQTAESKLLPLTVPPRPPAKTSPFPKFKSSFTKDVSTTGEKSFTVKYNTAIFVGLLVLIGLVLTFTLGVLMGEKRVTKPPVTDSIDSSDEPKTSPIPHKTSTEPSPAPATSQWGIRLIYYKNDSRGQYNAQRMIAWANEHGIAKTFKITEYIGGIDQICVYAGPYTSRQKAEKALPNLRSKHRGFRGADIEKLK